MFKFIKITLLLSAILITSIACSNDQSNVETISQDDLDYIEEKLYGKSEQQNVSTIESTNDNEKLFEILDVKGIKEDGYIKINGAIKNISNDTRDFIKIKTIYLDEDENVLDTDWTYAASGEGLRNNERKNFEIRTKMNDPEKYKDFTIEIIDYN